jgi:hypothetical protein
MPRDLGFLVARLAGFEPATRCLEGRFRQQRQLRLPRSDGNRVPLE